MQRKKNQPVGRKRTPDAVRKKTWRLSTLLVRLTTSERAAIEKASGDKPASTWLRELALKTIGFQK